MTITPPDWMREPALLNLMQVLNDDGLNALLVGGCVRDHLYGTDVHDIDIATTLSPDAMMDRLTHHGIRVIPTGVKYGTVTAVMNHKHYEVTTLRHDHNPDGRHADVTFDANWEDDAARRDFTVNALYASCDGSIYDPLGTALDDLHNKVVRFIGDPEKRIHEDALRILRFFRFYARFHDGDVHGASFAACEKAKQLIENLSSERIVDEVYKILALDCAPKALQEMRDADLFDIHNIDQLARLIDLQKQLNCIDLNIRYLQINFDKKYIKNNKIISFFNVMDEFKSAWDEDVKLALYRFDRQVVLQGLLSLKSEGKDITDIMISRVMNDPAPQFPIIAADIMGHFKIEEGPEVGQRLKQAENIWIDSDFQMKREEILEKF